MITIMLDRLVGSAARANQAVDRLISDNDGDISNENICIDFRENRSASSSYLEALVTRLVWIENSGKLLLRNVSRENARIIQIAARRHGLASLVHVMEPSDWLRSNQDLGVECICFETPCICGALTRSEFLSAHEL